MQLADAHPRPKTPTRHDDEHVRKYRRFLMHMRRGGDRRKLRLFDEDPGLYYAHQFYNHPDPEWKAIVDAKILAREDDDYLAADLATIPDAFTWYELLFFNVRERLHSQTYIVKTVMGAPATRVTGFDDVISDDLRYMLYKMFAYFGGSLMLDTIISGFQRGPLPTKPDRCREWLDEALQTTLRQRAVLTSHAMSVNRFTCMQLLELHVRMMESAEQARIAGGAVTEYTQNIEQYMNQVFVAVGDKALAGSTEETRQFQHTGIEPRAHEQELLASGHIPESLQSREAFERPVASTTEVKELSDAATDG